MDLLKVENVSKHYSNHTALDNISLTVEQGKIYGLLGPNGAGKTTLIRIINHITAPDSGRVIFDGHQLSQADVNNIGYLPEERGLYKKMKVGDQALFFARLKGLNRTEATRRLSEWFERLGISSWWDKKVEELSKGMAQKIQFIVTVLHEPKLLIFDEPFSGFDPINANILKNEILRLRDLGATVIFSTHNMSSVEALCDDITLINNSHNILTGNVAEIREQLGYNRYKIGIEGNGTKLLEALGDRIVESHTEDSGNNKSSIILKLKKDITARELLRIANETANIIDFAPALPSMDEIFISTVNKYNQEKTTETK